MKQFASSCKMGYFLLIALLFVGMITVAPAQAETPQARMVMFWAETCPYCHVVKDQIFPVIVEYYGDQVEISLVNLSEQAQYEAWVATMEAYQVPVQARGVPMLFIGDAVMVGAGEIADRLPAEIERYLAAGGVDYPDIPGLLDVLEAYDVPESTPAPQPTPTVSEKSDDQIPIAEATEEPTETPLVKEPQPTPTGTPAAVAKASPPLHVAYFYQIGCPECDRVQLDLNYLSHQYQQLEVHHFDVREDTALAEWLGKRAGVPERKRLVAPVVFIGDDALVDTELHLRSLQALLEKYEDSGAEPVWEGWEEEQSETVAGIVGRFLSLGVATVLLAGLIDGLNPCAFATIIFFISYLTIMGRRGKEVLAVGVAFALGVFLTYFGVGLGILRFLAALPFLHVLSKWIYGITAALCLSLAIVSLYDWWHARKGRHEEMRLKLPARLRRWINRVIRQGAGMRAIIPVALVTGGVVSIIELACTGQVYLPTILFVLGHPELQAQATLYLVLYNLMFIMPLVIVFLLAYLGTTSDDLMAFISRNTAKVKLATAALFTILAVWLVALLV